MERIKITYHFSEIEPWNDIAIAALSEIGYDSFIELENGIEAYINIKEFDEELLNEGILKEISEQVQIDFSIEKIPFQNWNAVWESDFKPVFVEDKLTIIAPFHDKNLVIGMPIIIQPQMSFGTGHHQTTWMMSKILLDLPKIPDNILDMGTGTGVLAIIAEKLGAKSICAIDIEPWSVENTIENAERNQCVKIEALCGDVDLINGKKFDLVLANINKNVLKQQMQSYVHSMNTGAMLVLSGFFETDIDELVEVAISFGLTFESKLDKETWASIKLIKN
jgi:ribosomal protein L11 methyltransferase